jgi:hypothetical protein
MANIEKKRALKFSGDSFAEELLVLKKKEMLFGKCTNKITPAKLLEFGVKVVKGYSGGDKREIANAYGLRKYNIFTIDKLLAQTLIAKLRGDDLIILLGEDN